MKTLDYSREEIELNDLGIIMPSNNIVYNIIYYYEIRNVQVVDLYEASASIMIYTKDNTVLRIWYDSGELLEKLEGELNYFISSVLED